MINGGQGHTVLGIHVVPSGAVGTTPAAIVGLWGPSNACLLLRTLLQLLDEPGIQNLPEVVGSDACLFSPVCC